MLACALAVALAGNAARAADHAPAMVRIPAGAFTMGSDDGPADERPSHRIDLHAFAIDRLPVTNADFAAFLEATRWLPARGPRHYDHDDPDARIHAGSTGWQADPGYERHPVVEVPWAGALAYCEQHGKRLPTEAEWEKAARGTDARRYPWGNARPDETRAQFGAAHNATAAVGTRPNGASPYGVLDMAGNVWEWVSSAYRGYPYRAADGREDPQPGPIRGTRGGGHSSPADHITTTHRGRHVSRNPAAGHHNIGFRCARSL